LPTPMTPRPPAQRPPYLPPTVSTASATTSFGYKWSAPPTSSLFLSSSFAHAPPLLLVTPCQHRPSHPGPLSAASSGHPLPDRRLLKLHPTSVHLYDPSSSSPDNPSSPSPPFLPARRTPPRTPRSSLSSAKSTTPRASRRRVRPPRTASCRPPPLNAAPTTVPLRLTTPRHRARSSSEDLPILTP
jgi:hypothetical protein